MPPESYHELAQNQPYLDNQIGGQYHKTQAGSHFQHIKHCRIYQNINAIVVPEDTCYSMQLATLIGHFEVIRAQS